MTLEIQTYTAGVLPLSEPVPIFHREEVRWGGFIGGDAVYIARYMLGIDIDYSNPNVQFSKGSGDKTVTELLKVFPNPATDILWLSFANAIKGGYQIDIFNYAGVNVFTETVSKTEAQHQINTTQLTNGLYFVTVKTNTETYKSKFTVIK
ncbi:MAG: T9SS type A sorting domain-containing protein [Bacteroidales bacterium]